MKLAFSAPTRDAQQAETLFTQLQPIGYDGIQLKTAQFSADLDQPQAFLDRWPQLRGRISGLITGGGVDERGREQLRRIFRFAGAVGGEMVILCQSGPRNGLDADDLRQFAGTLDDLGAEARDAGTRLSLHHHFDQPCMHRPDFDIFFNRPRSYGLTVDTAHLAKSGITDIAEIIRTFHASIDNFHMKDFAQGQFQVLGEGAIDFRPVFDAVREVGYNGWMAADEESGADLAGAMRQCLAFMQRGLQET